MAAGKKKVAIFDIDGTVFRSSLFIELVEELLEEGLFPPEAERGYRREEMRWRNRQGDYESYLMAMVRVFEKHLKGVPYGAFVDAAKRVIARKKDQIYRYSRELVKKLKKDGYYLLAISQSPKSVLEPFSKRLGFDKVYGRIYEIGPTARFTGTVADIHLIANKANIVKRAVLKEGLTLKDSIGVGDTEGDIAFLELVENPICFNPNAVLYKHARRNGWKVVVERKDVIYEIGSAQSKSGR